MEYFPWSPSHLAKRQCESSGHPSNIPLTYEHMKDNILTWDPQKQLIRINKKNYLVNLNCYFGRGS